MDLISHQEKIVSEFNSCEDWTERMRLLIAKGSALDTLTENDRQECTVIKNCQTTLWVRCSVVNNTVQLTGDCDSKSMRGIMALCIELLNDRSIEECSGFDFTFFDRIGLDTVVSSNRSTGLDDLSKAICTALKQTSTP